MIKLELKEEHRLRYEEEKKKKKPKTTFRPIFDSCSRKREHVPGPNNASMLWLVLIREDKDLARFMDEI